MGRILNKPHYTEEEKTELVDAICTVLFNGSSRENACKPVKLPPSTLGSWIKTDDEIRAKVESAEAWLEMLSEEIIHKSVKLGNTDIAKWYLEHRAKARYNTQTTTIIDTKTQEQREALSDILKDITNNEPTTTATNDKAVS